MAKKSFGKLLSSSISNLRNFPSQAFGGDVGNFILGEKPMPGGFGVIPLDPELVAMQSRARALQGTGLDALKESQNFNAEEVANKQVQDEIKLASGGLQDARMKIQQMMAQRGLGKTSLGMRSQMGAETANQERVQELQASLPERIRALREQRAQTLLAGSGKVLADQGARPDTYSYDSVDNSRRGGVLPSILGGIGSGLGKKIGGG
jgi:hypothetical protein